MKTPRSPIASYKLVIFDWEGTLGDTLGHVLNTISEQANLLQFGVLDKELARQYSMLGLVRSVNKFFPHLSLHQQEQLLHAVQQALAINSSETSLFPGARHIVQQMHQAGLMLAIASNKSMHTLQRAIEDSGLDVFFTVTRAVGQVPPKPCPQMLEEIMDIFDIKAEETLMIGDSVTDMDTASAAGVDALGVDFYHTQESDLLEAGALAVFDSYPQVANYLQLHDFKG
jgi:phosphoglycolate phosphatase